MGIYINPKNLEKEDWLIEFGDTVVIPKLSQITETHSLVCLVGNGLFTAACICDSKREFDTFHPPSDGRPRIWFIVSNSDIEASF